MAGRSSERLGLMVLHSQDGFHDKLGRDNGVRRGQGLRVVNEKLTLEGDTVAALLSQMLDVRAAPASRIARRSFATQNVFGREDWRRGEVEDKVLVTSFRERNLTTSTCSDV